MLCASVSAPAAKMPPPCDVYVPYALELLIVLAPTYVVPLVKTAPPLHVVPVAALASSVEFLMLVAPVLTQNAPPSNLLVLVGDPPLGNLASLPVIVL